MAWIEKREGKNGQITYRISVSAGMDRNGRQIVRRKVWRPDPDMSEKQIEKNLLRAQVDFEREIELGYQPDQRQTFAEYAQYVLDLKERTGVRPRTIDRYRELLVRINEAMGHMKLQDIRPRHLNEFYKNLSEPGIRAGLERATLKTDLRAWIAKRKISQASVARGAGISASTVSEALKGRPISLVKAAAIAKALDRDFKGLFTVSKRTDPLSNKTVLEYHRLISTILGQAEKEMLIPYNPAAKATPPRVQRQVPDYFQPEEIADILQALETVPLRWKALTYFLIDTGCRRGEAAGLKWDSVDLDSRVVTIERALLYSPKRGVYEGPPKTGLSRTIRIAQETANLLREYRSYQEYVRSVLQDRWVDSGYVFTQDDGSRMNPDSITSWLADFSAKNGLPHIHPHAFRHTAASTMIAAGVDLVTTANELGHANAATTATIYAHQIATAKARAGDVRSSIFKLVKEEKCPPSPVGPIHKNTPKE